MKKRIKTAGALTLAAITVLSAAGLSSVYGALGAVSYTHLTLPTILRV